MMKLPENFQMPSLFMGNFFCIIPNTNVAFVIISKNACTFLKKVAIYNKKNIWPKGFREIHNEIGYNQDSEYLIPVNKIRNYEKQHGKLLKFAVWRDPIERVVSTYKLFCVEREYRTYFHFLGINKNISFKRFMDFMIFEWGKSDPMLQDEHIRRQVDYYKNKDVDHIIPMHQLNAFLESNGVAFVNEISNKTKSEFEINDDDYLAAIKKYYQSDYKIQTKFQEPSYLR